MDNLIKVAKVSRPSAAVVAAQTDVQGSGVDMAGFDEVTFLFMLGTLSSNASVTCKVQQSVDDVDGDYSDITGSAQVVDDTNSNKIVAITVYRPLKEFVRPVVLRGGSANAIVDGIVAIQAQAKYAPSTQSSDVAASTAIMPAA
jgi:hypothetical protein